MSSPALQMQPGLPTFCILHSVSSILQLIGLLQRQRLRGSQQQAQCRRVNNKRLAPRWTPGAARGALCQQVPGF